MNKRFALLGLVAVASIASASMLVSKITVSIAGKSVTVDSVVVSGKTYVSLDQLKTQLNAQGGANQLGASSGVMNEWLFNGVWRFRVTGIAYSEEEGGWLASVEIRNGYKTSMTPKDNGMAFNAADGFFLTFNDGNTVEPTDGAKNQIQDAIGLKSLPPGGGTVAKVRFPGEPGWKPEKLLFEMKPMAGLPFVKEPSFRVDLTKSK